jgi:Zn-dependent peptidase ImmA (M78 family)
MKLVNKFVKFVVKELGLQSLPKSIKFEGNDYSAQHLTFGTYQPDADEIVIVKGNRHPVDVLRTLAHELVHHKQRLDGKALNGEDGSDIENEANAVAGTLMRKFRTEYPDIFRKSPENKMQAIRKIAKTGTPQQIDETYVDTFTAKLLLTVADKLTPENKEKFVNESIDKMVAVAYKMVTR